MRCRSRFSWSNILEIIAQTGVGNQAILEDNLVVNLTRYAVCWAAGGLRTW